jgi:response regulator RpfG family c-di-GMP phosphodiesterase
LAGEDIPLGSRIIAVSEAFDILTSDVPWRDAMDQESALSELEACAGTQFDPEMVEAFRIAITSGIVER